MAITIQFVFGKKQETMSENREQNSYQHFLHFPSETTRVFNDPCDKAQLSALSQGSLKHGKKQEML